MRYTPFLLRELVADDSPLSPLEVLAAIRNFPMDSATYTSLRGGGDARGWDMNTYMLANVVDAVHYNTYVLTAANSKRKPKPPKPIPRPKGKKKSPGPGGNKFAAMARMARARAVKAAQIMKGD